MLANVKKRNPVAIAFGKVLRAAREKVDLSQEGLGLACGIDRTYVSMLERGERQPTLTTVFALCDELGIHPEQLVADTRQIFRKGGG